ncbi:hypothetical protein Tco_0280505 [Tanacetum coccineum]
MSTQSSSNQIRLHLPNPEKSLRFCPKEISESDNIFLDHMHGEDENSEDVQMADHLRPMKELFQIPIVGIEDAIIVPTVLANEFELKIELLDFITFYFDVDHQEEKSSGSTTFHSNLSLPSYESFCFDIDHQEEKSSGTTTSQSDHSLPDYEAFCFDHQEDKRSGSTTSHSDPSILEYESFYFDLSIDPLPPTEKSDSHQEEFADELAHIISPPEYDHFYFNIKVDPGELTRLLIENSSSKNVDLTEIKEDNELKPKTPTKELTIHELNDLRLLLSNSDSTFFEEFSEIKFLVSFLSENKDKIFDPRIFIFERVYFKRSPILPLNDFSSKSFVSDLLLTDPSKIKTFLSFPSGNEDKVFDPGILLIDGVFSFTRKSPHLLDYDFKNDKRFLMIEKIPSDESKVRIEVLSVLWGNRLPIPDGSLPLSRYKGLKTKQKR